MPRQPFGGPVARLEFWALCGFVLPRRQRQHATVAAAAAPQESIANDQSLPTG
jgi:hypothetical protein